MFTCDACGNKPICKAKEITSELQNEIDALLKKNASEHFVNIDIQCRFYKPGFTNTICGKEATFVIEMEEVKD